MRVWVVLDRSGYTETRGVSGTREECVDMVAHLRRSAKVARVLNDAGQEIHEPGFEVGRRHYYDDQGRLVAYLDTGGES